MPSGPASGFGLPWRRDVRRVDLLLRRGDKVTIENEEFTGTTYVLEDFGFTTNTIRLRLRVDEDGDELDTGTWAEVPG